MPDATNRISGAAKASLALLFALAVPCTPSWSQSQSLPGIIIAPSPAPMPGGPPPPMGSPMMNPMMPPPQAAPPPAPPPQAAPQPKPKPKVAARPKATEDAGAEGGGAAKGPGTTRISVLVNGEPITAYEIEQRARLMMLSGGDIQGRAQAEMKRLATSESVNARWKQIIEDTVRANQGKSREQIMAILQERQKTFSMGLQKQALDSARSAAIPAKRADARKELIEEMVKLQDARRNGAAPDESMVDDLIKDLAQRNKMTPAEFAKHLSGMGIDIATMKARYRAQLGWTDAVRKQYSHLVQPSQRQLDQALVNFTGGTDQVEMHLHRIVLSLPPKVEQRAMAQRLAEAEQIQRQFKNCTSISALAAKAQGARYENMGVRTVDSFSEPSRSMLLNAPDNAMVPPVMTSSGIEVYAVCGRRVIKAEELKRTQLATDFRQEQFERLSRNHLRKLMDNAIIENR